MRKKSTIEHDYVSMYCTAVMRSEIMYLVEKEGLNMSSYLTGLVYADFERRGISKEYMMGLSKTKKIKGK